MEYILNKEDGIYYYDVTYDEEKLRQIMEQVKDYSYTCYYEGVFGGLVVTAFPATNKNVKRRTIQLFYITTYSKRPEATIYPESIIRHKNENTDYVSFVASYRKIPDLYDYLDLIINNKNIIDFKRIFTNSDRDFGLSYLANHRDQLIMDGLFGYSDSKELINHDERGLGKQYGTGEEEYDYQGLRALYSEVMKCFRFTLKAKKVNVLNEEAIDASQLLKK